jgi:3-dehydroquinate synthase
MQILNAAQKTKKTVAGRPCFVLPTAIGTVEITADVSEALIDQVLAA